jgi:hypothetical protein
MGQVVRLGPANTQGILQIFHLQHRREAVKICYPFCHALLRYGVPHGIAANPNQLAKQFGSAYAPCRAFQFDLSSTTAFFGEKFVSVYQLETLLAVWQEDEAGKGSSLFTDGSLCVPPTVTVEYYLSTARPWNFRLRRRSGPVKEQRAIPVLCYPLPEEWQVPLSGTMMAYGGLINQGWKWRESSTGLFNDFLRLADMPDRDVLTEEVCSKVAAFARKWGPMWICRTPGHGQACYWRPDISLRAATSVVRWTANSPRGREPAWLRYQKKNPCQWIPMEEVAVFLQKARQVKGIFEAIVRLQNGEPVSESLWQLMELQRASDRAPESREEQLWMLCSLLQIQLSWGSEVRASLGWDNGPKLKLVPPLGFIHVVVFTLAQLLCQARGAYQCDGCGNFYIRSGKRPQAGKRNFCTKCGKKASKRQWAQRQRQKGKTDDRQADA